MRLLRWSGMRSFPQSPASTLLIAVALVLLTATTASADFTAFIGLNGTPERRAVKGLAIGTGLLIVGFEVEYADTSEDEELLAPRLRTIMFNGLVQTPVPIAGMQFYGTIGGGGYRESFNTVPEISETNFGTNIGGGAKISIAGPLRVRVDYRVFNLRGNPRHSPVQRFYAGVNLKF